MILTEVWMTCLQESPGKSSLHMGPHFPDHFSLSETESWQQFGGRGPSRLNVIKEMEQRLSPPFFRRPQISLLPLQVQSVLQVSSRNVWVDFRRRNHYFSPSDSSNHCPTHLIKEQQCSHTDSMFISLQLQLSLFFPSLHCVLPLEDMYLFIIIRK